VFTARYGLNVFIIEMDCASETSKYSNFLGHIRKSLLVKIVSYMMSMNGKLLCGRKCSGTVTLRADTNTVTASSYGRDSKDPEYGPGHPYYKATVPGTNFPVKIN